MLRGKGGKNATHRNDEKRRTPEAKRSLIDSLYADAPGTAPDWLDSRLLSTGQVALLFQVSRRSVTAWARAGKLPSLITPGGHRRYRVRDVRALLDAATGDPPRTA